VARDPGSARLLGLWTAGWLAVLLLGGLLWLGDLSVQWPVLGVPLLWALVALRPRRRPDDAEDDWQPIPPPDRSRRQGLGHRTDTVERPALRNRDADDRY
jgi:hypothetical protein